MLSTPPPACVSEGALPRRIRREAGALLAGEWGPQWRRCGHAGPHPPAFRAVAHNNAGYLIAHVSAFELACEPSLRLFGVGDLVVKQRYRGRGHAHAVCELLVAECRAQGAEAILVDTLAARHVFARLGFRAVQGFEFFHQAQNRCTRKQHWMVWCGDPAPGKIEILAHWDF